MREASVRATSRNSTHSYLLATLSSCAVAVSHNKVANKSRENRGYLAQEGWGYPIPSLTSVFLFVLIIGLSQVCAHLFQLVHSWVLLGRAWIWMTPSP
jgi:hypothetical protein